MADEISLPESVSMAVGGMVGGGIFAVLGVVANAAGTAAWLAFSVAGAVALCAGYAAVRLNDRTPGDKPLNPVGYVEHQTGRRTLAGMTGWTFVVGYVGTMALYAYAFGGYATEFLGESIAGVPVHPVVSVTAVAAFVGLNAAGAHASGRTEDALVALKVLILLVFVGGGLWYGYANGKLTTGLAGLHASALLAAAMGFVAFEGWELLLFDQESIEDAAHTVAVAIGVSIVSVTVLYALVAVVTTDLVSAATIRQNAETSLAVAARPFFGETGFLLISVAALFSTASALNATLFSASRLTRSLVADDLLPSALRANDAGEPVRPLVVLGVLAAAFTLLGSLDAISSFASLSFVTIFGSFCALALRVREGAVSTVVPVVGLLGAAATVVGLLYHLAVAKPHVLVTVVVVAALVVGVEVLYFERDAVLP